MRAWLAVALVLSLGMNLLLVWDLAQARRDASVLRARREKGRRYLDEWEASYGMGDRPLPEHWGTTQRIADLRDLLDT